MSDKGKRIVPCKFAHAVLKTNKFREMVDWYRTVLEADIAFSNEMLAFMTYDDEHHRIAIAGFPGLVDRPRNAVGLDHLAYTYANLGDLIATYERLKSVGITPAVAINHGLTTLDVLSRSRWQQGRAANRQLRQHRRAQGMFPQRRVRAQSDRHQLTIPTNSRASIMRASGLQEL